MPIDLPPPAYSGPYGGALVEIVDSRVVRERCAAGQIACSFVLSRSACVVILPSEGSDYGRALLRHHELGHCNGWPSTHPDPRRAAPGIVPQRNSTASTGD